LPGRSLVLVGVERINFAEGVERAINFKSVAFLTRQKAQQFVVL
jgi:hypothetical protein